jgi:hypothetical protein
MTRGNSQVAPWKRLPRHDFGVIKGTPLHEPKDGRTREMLRDVTEWHDTENPEWDGPLPGWKRAPLPDKFGAIGNRERKFKEDDPKKNNEATTMLMSVGYTTPVVSDHIIDVPPTPEEGWTKDSIKKLLSTTTPEDTVKAIQAYRARGFYVLEDLTKFSVEWYNRMVNGLADLMSIRMFKRAGITVDMYGLLAAVFRKIKDEPNRLKMPIDALDGERGSKYLSSQAAWESMLREIPGTTRVNPTPPRTDIRVWKLVEYGTDNANVDLKTEPKTELKEEEEEKEDDADPKAPENNSTSTNSTSTASPPIDIDQLSLYTLQQGGFPLSIRFMPTAVVGRRRVASPMTVRRLRSRDWTEIQTNIIVGAKPGTIREEWKIYQNDPPKHKEFVEKLIQSILVDRAARRPMDDYSIPQLWERVIDRVVDIQSSSVAEVDKLLYPLTSERDSGPVDVPPLALSEVRQPSFDVGPPMDRESARLFGLEPVSDTELEVSSSDAEAADLEQGGDMVGKGLTRRHKRRVYRYHPYNSNIRRKRL